MAEGLPAITEILIQPFLYDNKATELVMCNFSVGYGGKAVTAKIIAVRSFPCIFDEEKHKHLK